MNPKHAAAALGLLLLGGGTLWWAQAQSDPAASPSSDAPESKTAPNTSPPQTSNASGTGGDARATPRPAPASVGSPQTRPIAPVADSDPRSPPAPPPERVELPASVADRPFAFSDGSFLHLWQAQQQQAARAGCWEPLAAEGLSPPLGVNFDLQIAADGSLLYYGPSLNQMQRAVVGGQRPEDVNITRLYHCLVPFVRAIRYPPGPAQSGQVFAARGKPSSTG